MSEWRVVSAVHGRGTLLLGPLVQEGETRGWVFAPPGVRLATPESDDPAAPPISISGWREALWMPDADGTIAIDHGRPISLDTCRFGTVLEHVCSRCPEHLSWIWETLDDYLRTLHLQTRQWANGARAPSHKLATRAMNALVADTEEALEALDDLVTAVAPPGATVPRAGALRVLKADLDAQAKAVEADRRARVRQRAPTWPA